MIDPPDKASWRSLPVAALLLLAVVPYFVNLGTPPLWDANEPLYAQPPREVLEWPEGDFLAPTWNGRPYFAHAPLSTWITVPFYAWLGAGELGHRLPMALAALLTVLATWRLGTRTGGPRVGLLAAVLLAATPRYWLYARQLSGDVYLVALLAWAFALAVPVVAGGGRLRDLRWANVLVGVGFLAKGPVILALYAGTLLIAWAAGRPRATWSELRPVRGLLLLLAVGVPWFAYMAVRYQHLDFLGQHFGHYTFGRVLGTIGQRGFFWYPQTLLGDAQPWICVLPFGVVMALRRDRRVGTLLPLAGIAWILLLFTCSAGKRNVYMLPLYPLVALCVAPVGVAVIDGAYRWSARLAGGAGALGCLAGAVCLHLVGVHEPGLRPEIHWLTGLLAAAFPLLAWAAWQGRGRLVTIAALGTVLAAQTAAALALPALARFRPVPAFAERIRLEQDPAHPEPAVLYGVAIHSLNFYLGRATLVAADADDLRAKLGDRTVAFVVCPAARWEGRGSEGRRTGLREELGGAVVDELDRRPLLSFRFSRSVLGRDAGPTQELLLLRVSLPSPAGAER